MHWEPVVVVREEGPKYNPHRATILGEGEDYIDERTISELGLGPQNTTG